MAKAVATHLNYTYIDSGAMYRAVTLFCMNAKLIKDNTIDEEQLRAKIDQIQIEFRSNLGSDHAHTYLNGVCVEETIRELTVSKLVSPVSKIPFVRTAMVKLQRKLSQNRGVVMDGRDIGTVVFPHADLKIFMTASDEIRAQRRYDELKAKGQEVEFAAVLHNIRERDYIDSNRETSPLRQAEDAVVLDNSYLNRKEQLEWILSLIKERFSHLSN